MNCPRCSSELEISKRLIIGATLFRCSTCRTYQIDGDDLIVDANWDSLERLELRARKLGLIDVDKEIAESSWEDPRWEMIQYE